METNLQVNLNHHMAVARALNRDIHSEAFHGTIRALLTTVQVAKKKNFKLDEPPDLESLMETLIADEKFAIDIAIVAGKIYCLARINISKNPAAVEDLFAVAIQKETIPKMCYLFGIIDCLSCEKLNSIVTSIGDEILEILRTFNSAHFHQVKLLHSWLLYVRSISHLLPSCCSDTTTTNLRRNFLLPQSEMIELINIHWETPPMQSLLDQCLTTICEIWRIVQPTSQFADILAKLTLTNLSWKSKTKYLILTTLVPFTHFSEILCEFPDTVFAMTASLESNCLLPVGTALFKALTKHLNADQWEDYCQIVLLDALNHSNRNAQHNAVHYWIPCLSHASPVVIVELRQRLLEAEHLNWLAYIALLKLMEHLDERDRLLTQQALQHSEDEVRAAAFGLLLHSHKKTEPILPEEWIMVNDFLMKNLSSDNPQFRLKILSTTRLFLIRILESCLFKIKTNGCLDEDIENLQAFYNSLLRCLSPLSNYQRKIASLTILRYILQLFGDSDELAEKLAKGAGLARRRQLINYTRDRWIWSGKEALDHYTVCLMDEVNDVRQKAADILQDFFPHPPREYVQLLYSQGCQLCDSAKFQRSECGATIMQLISHWASTNTDLIPELTVNFLIEQIRCRFNRLKLDWLTGAAQEPIHGFVGALAKVLQLPHHRSWVSAHKDLIALSQTISCYMLDTLAIKSTAGSDLAPSFEEMSQSIDEIVRRSNTAPITESISISIQQQLVLSCAWLNLKETGNLAVQVATMLLNDGLLPEEERARQIEQCVEVIYKILLRCRHKGAIEAAGEAMGFLCRRLFASQVTTIRTIPEKILVNFLERLESQKIGSNITRRSAGLAFLVCKIVSSQLEKFSPDSLLSVATRRLIAVAQRSVEVDNGQGDICDLPQSVAMHLLKSLVHDASLNIALQPDLMEPIVRLSVDSFAHPHWSVRNAALQLHGAVIPRLMGLSSKTTVEIFHRLPGLESFFLEKLDEQPKDRMLVSGGLIPTLSILSRLTPGYRNDSVNARFTSSLFVLLGHPVIQVRQLAAQSLLAFVPLFKTKVTTMRLCDDAEILASLNSEDTPLNMCVRGSSKTNSLHGCLLALHEFLNRCREVALSVEDWEMIRKAVATLALIEKNHSSYYIKLAVLKLFQQLPGLSSHLEWAVLQEESVRKLYSLQPGFGDWMRLKTELIVKHISLNTALIVMCNILPPKNGMDVVEVALREMKNRLARLSSSSILVNTVTGFVIYYIAHWEEYPSVLPVCLEFVQARGAKALLESDTSLQWYLDFFLEKCIDSRQLGSTVALFAIPTVAVVVKEMIEKNLMKDTDMQEVITRLTHYLLEASQPEESLSFRSAAAASLKLAGRTLVEMPNKNAETSRNLFLLILNLVQDEEKDVRADTASFLADLLSSFDTNSSPEQHRLLQLSPTRCLEGFSKSVHHWFSPQNLFPVLFELLKESDSSKDKLESLYEREPANFFREETGSVSFLLKVAESLSAVTASDVLSSQLGFDMQEVIEEVGHDLICIQSNSSFENGAATEWHFVLPSAICTVLTRLSARLTIISLCYPTSQTNPRFIELRSTVEKLSRYRTSV